MADFDVCLKLAKLHLAFLTFDAGQVDTALTHLKERLSWRVQQGRDTCDGVGKRGARSRQCSRVAAAV